MLYKAAITEADDTCRTNAAGQFACGELTTQGDWRSNRPVRDNNEYHLSYSIRLPIVNLEAYCYTKAKITQQLVSIVISACIVCFQ